MQIVRYNPATAEPLPGGNNAFFEPIRVNGRVKAVLIVLDRKGDTGRRNTPVDTLIMVIAGTGTIRSGGTVAELMPGDILTVPGGRPHQLWTTSDAMHVVIAELSVEMG